MVSCLYYLFDLVRLLFVLFLMFRRISAVENSINSTDYIPTYSLQMFVTNLLEKLFTLCSKYILGIYNIGIYSVSWKSLFQETEYYNRVLLLPGRVKFCFLACCLEFVPHKWSSVSWCVRPKTLLSPPVDVENQLRDYTRG